MDVISYLQTEMDKHLTKARAIADAADAEGRGLSEVEREEAQAELAQVAELKSRLGDEQDKMRLREAVDGFDRMQMGVDPHPVREPSTLARAKTLGDAFVQSEVFQMLQAKFKASGGLAENTITPAINVPNWRTKAAGDPVLESDSTDIFGTGGNAGQLATQVAGQFPLQPRLVVADLLPSIPVTTGNAAFWPVMETRTAIAGTPQTEGAAKEAGEYVAAVDSAALVTLAGWIKISTQYLEDAPAIVAYINQDLPYQIRFNEEVYLLAALYLAAGLSADGTGLVTAPNGFDAIREVMALIQENNGTPNGLIISPTDWAALETVKSGAVPTSGGYIGGGPFGQNGGPLWNGLQVVVTSAATEGLPLVGDFSRAARVFRRGGLSMTSTNADGTDFQKNIVTIRAEIRLAIGVSYPNLLGVAGIGTS